jgi:uncharacterized membrane protein YccC
LTAPSAIRVPSSTVRVPDEVRDHAVDTQRGHEQRRQPEERHDDRAQTLELQRVAQDVVHHADVAHRQRRVGLPDARRAAATS